MLYLSHFKKLSASYNHPRELSTESESLGRGNTRKLEFPRSTVHAVDVNGELAGW